jgi:hypothetical protein
MRMVAEALSGNKGGHKANQQKHDKTISQFSHHAFSLTVVKFPSEAWSRRELFSPSSKMTLRRP